MKVQKRTKSARRSDLIQGLLRDIGIPKNKLYPRGYRSYEKPWGNFWERPEGELLSLLQDSKMRYRQLIKQHHPDRLGSHEYAAELNRIWSRIKALFAKRNLTLP